MALSPFPATTSPTQRANAVARLKAAAGSRGDDDSMAALGEAASAMVERYAPDAPQALRDEAVIRFAGYLAQSDFGGFRKEGQGVGNAPGPEYVTNHAPAFRNSGAAMLLTRWKRRRAGVIA